MSKELDVKFDKQINGFIGAYKEVINGQEVWVKVAPTKKCKGYVKALPRTKK